MWWECSECGGQLQRSSAPVVCPECGMAGIIFMPVEPDEVIAADSTDDLGALWLRAGIEQHDFIATA
jgi:DNA-directed RNA polymerase subunit RPC12/RpoP